MCVSLYTRNPPPPLPTPSLHLSFLAALLLSFLLLPTLCSNLSNNRITDIEEGTFEGASGVNELILTSNRLENIHHRMLKGLSGLRTLWVHTHPHTHTYAYVLSMPAISKDVPTYCDTVKHRII